MNEFPLSAVPTEGELGRIGFHVCVGLELVDGTVLATFRSRNGVNDLFVLAIRPAHGESFENTELADLVIDLGTGLGNLHKYWDEYFGSVEELQEAWLTEIIPRKFVTYGGTLSIKLHQVITEDAAEWAS